MPLALVTFKWVDLFLIRYIRLIEYFIKLVRHSVEQGTNLRMKV